MNPFLEEDDDSIPLKARSRTYMDNTTDDTNSNKNNDDDNYGTFNPKMNQSKSANNISLNHLNNQQPSIQRTPQLKPTKNKTNTNTDTNTTKQSTTTTIRTDRVTGNKYRRLRSIPIAEDAQIPTLNYEKEVFNSMNVFQLAPRNESLHNLWLHDQQSHHQSISRDMTRTKTRTDRFSKKDVSDEVLHGYQWLGRSSPWREHLTKAASNVWHNQVIALLLLALMVTVVAFIISQMTSFCWGVINYVYTNKMYNPVLIFLGCLVLKCGFVFAAIFFTITTPQTAGSGIPELKAILSGIWIRRYLSIRGFFIKSLALVCALGSGLPIGIEGPVIHISAIIGRQLTRISMFRHIDRKMLLSAACACGIAVIFSAPIGGVLFSIEVTHHYYKIDSYWSAFLCATFAALFTTIVQAIAPTTLQLLHTSFSEEAYQTYEFIIFSILGGIAGFMGASYVQLHRYFTLLRPRIARYHSGFWNNAYVLAGIVTSTYVLCAFILGEFAFQPSRMAISDLFNATNLEKCSDPVNECNFTDWGDGLGRYWNLFFFTILNYSFSIWFLVLDWPCGCFASVFAIGAASGRLLGEILNDTIMNWTHSSVLAATYAVVGAAALVSGVTRTFSVAVIVLEMTQSVQLSVPVLLAVIISWTIASWLSDSLYDSILNLRGIPLLPITPKHPTNFATSPIRPFIAADLMVDIKQYGYLNDKSSFKEVALMLQHSNEIFFPVLQTKKPRTLLGEVSRQILESELKSHGYGKATNARFKLLESATKRFESISKQKQKQNQNNINPFSLELLTSYKSSSDHDIDDDHEIISIKDDDHFSSLLDPQKSSLTLKLIQSAPPTHHHHLNINITPREITDGDCGDDDDDEKEKIHQKKPTKRIEKKKKRRHRWDEKKYLKRQKERCEWIRFNEAKWIQHMNISPVTVIPTMPITQIYVLFHVLHPDKIYVAKRNELVGVIDEHILLERERLERKGGASTIHHHHHNEGDYQ